MTPPIPPMDEQAIRTKIRALIASGVLSTDPYANIRRLERGETTSGKRAMCRL
jgi:hypothetical protein